MRILIVSVEYGIHTGPEGICSQRLVDALTKEGLDINVLTTRVSGSHTPDFKERALRSFTRRPSRVQASIGRLFVDAPVPQWDWVMRIERARLRPPLLVYARGNPLTSLVAGSRLASRLAVPFVAHFSDPIPSPWDDPSSSVTAHYIASVRRIIDHARLLTFTTPEAISYMSEIYACDLAKKSVIVSNIVPDWKVNHSEISEERDIAYVGNFGGNRLPFSLAAAIALYNERNKPTDLCRLLLVGTAPHWERAIQDRFGTSVPLKRLRRTQDPLPHYTRAMISASVDADGEHPVFLATKTAEMIHAARRLLIISPSGSPARRLFAGRWESVTVSESKPEASCDAFERLLRVPLARVQKEITQRQEFLSPFRAATVANHFMEAISSFIPEARLREVYV